MTQQINRRTVTKGIAWSVPAVALAGAAPAFATSHEPPTPGFHWKNAVKNPGNSCTIAGCVPKHSYGVPVTVSNPTGDDVFIKFTGYKLGASSTGVGGTDYLVNNVGVYYTGTLNDETCEDRVPKPNPAICTTGPWNDANSVYLPTGTGSTTFWVFSGDAGNSSNVSQYVSYTWYDASTCAEISSSAGYSPSSPPNDACTKGAAVEATTEPAAEVTEPVVDAPAATEGSVEAAPDVEAPVVETTEATE